MEKVVAIPMGHRPLRLFSLEVERRPSKGRAPKPGMIISAVVASHSWDGKGSPLWLNLVAGLGGKAVCCRTGCSNGASRAVRGKGWG